MNKIIITGNLGQDPEIKALQSGSKVAEFSVAVRDRYNNEDRTLWIPCKFYGKLAETIEKYLSKGSKIGVEGKWAIDEWEKDGQKRVRNYILGQSFEFLSSKNDGSQTQSVPPMEDDLPF